MKLLKQQHIDEMQEYNQILTKITQETENSIVLAHSSWGVGVDILFPDRAKHVMFDLKSYTVESIV